MGRSLRALGGAAGQERGPTGLVEQPGEASLGWQPTALQGALWLHRCHITMFSTFYSTGDRVSCLPLPVPCRGRRACTPACPSR